MVAAAPMSPRRISAPATVINSSSGIGSPKMPKTCAKKRTGGPYRVRYSMSVRSITGPRSVGSRQKGAGKQAVDQFGDALASRRHRDDVGGLLERRKRIAHG